MSSTSEAILGYAIAAALRELRREQDLDPDDVWGATGVSPSALSALERGRRGLQFLEALYLADAYQTTLEAIADRAHEIVDDWVEGGSRIGRPNGQKRRPVPPPSPRQTEERGAGKASSETDSHGREVR